MMLEMLPISIEVIIHQTKDALQQAKKATVRSVRSYEKAMLVRAPF
jgi:hypothetical protein